VPLFELSVIFLFEGLIEHIEHLGRQHQIEFGFGRQPARLAVKEPVVLKALLGLAQQL
jgi:hypothetical protein